MGSGEFFPDSGFQKTISAKAEKKPDSSRSGEAVIGFDFKNSIGEAIEDYLRKKEVLRKEVENLPYEQEIFDRTEMAEIIDLRKKMDELAEKDNEERAELDFDLQNARKDFNSLVAAKTSELQKVLGRKIPVGLEDAIIHDAEREIYGRLDDISAANLDKATELLDKSKIWQTKFTTGDETYNEKTRKNCPYRFAKNVREDSLYYVTGSGISLRLKRVNLREGGLKETVQPFMEKIIFEPFHNDRPLSGKPVLDYWVREFLTEEFLTEQKKDVAAGDFKSPIKKYIKNGNVYAFSKSKYHHSGHQVNKIFFPKK